jgi:calmodulin
MNFNQFSPEKIEQCRRAFDALDFTRSGLINTKVLNTAMRSLGLSPTGRELLELITLIDPENNGTMSFNQFLTAVASKLMKDFSAGSVPEEHIRDAFAVFDRDSNGFITPDEVRHVLAEWGEKISDEEVQKMITEADQDGDGKVDFNEFKRMMTATNAASFPLFLSCLAEKALDTVDSSEEERIKEAFRLFDRDGNGLITRREIKEAMTELGDNMSDEDVDAMIKEADLNGDWELDYAEFRIMMLNKK